MAVGLTENRKDAQALFANCVIYAWEAFGHPCNVFTTDEILSMLDARGIKNIEVARALGVNPSRVTELKKGERKLQLEEAVKLVQAFGLEPAPAADPLPPPILRLVVEYVGMALGVPQERIHSRVGELTEDLRAFSELVADPKVRRSVEAAEVFFRAMVLRRPKAESEAPPGNDPERTH